ncbi:predicted 3'-5' exonuclease [Moesziomyces antarcticus T-34]|uniref:3'-5' exonuclease n=1 Tax=Pseudozyma antarctica (strain T-34) TaxID=1151754 RepID=M9MBS4_PSEA3|nr:predicted 3'-5' exonuclease [Moesziomyces antarcticus T-34]
MKLTLAVLPRRFSIPGCSRLGLVPLSASPLSQKAVFDLRGSSLHGRRGGKGWFEMPARARAKNRPPKTWASTHQARAQGQQQRHSSTTASKQSRYRPHQWKISPAKAAKEAEQERLERGLDIYTHTVPAGPEVVTGADFLLARSKPSSDSVAAVPQVWTAPARLKTPLLAYTADYDEAEELLSCLGPGPMGLDLEWNFTRFGGANRTALLQLCSSRMILVIHMSAMSHRVPPLLRTILQDPSIIKTGVAIRNDALKLQRDYAIHMRNVLELSNLAKLAQPARWASVGTLISLRDLTRIYLGRRLRKGDVRVSDWETFPLDQEQIEYAASDTFASLEVLRAIAEYFTPTPPDKERDRGGMLAKLDEIDASAQRQATREPLDLASALRLSAYDLLQERMQLTAAETQKQQLRTALRELRAPDQPKEPIKQSKPVQSPKPAASVASTSPTRPKRRAVAAKQDAGESSDEGVTVTRVLLAHDRAMHRWLYSSETIVRVALGSSIKPTTVAQYLLRALIVAKRTAWQGDAEAKQLLSRFSRDHQCRLDTELKAVGAVERKRYRMLAKSLGWSDVSESAKRRGSPSLSEDETSADAQKPAAVTSPVANRAVSPIEVAESDDEVDVVETSR